ncbi:MAG: DUF4062 domain-containing protein [Thermoleophilia bacterium]
MTPIRTPDQRLRVFVSSTLGELADERRAVRSSIEQLRLTPVMFEMGARPHPPRALYRSYLEQSDVFVGIYWQKYGWVAPDMDISGLEDEFVLSAGMPRLLYVKRPAPEMEPGLTTMLARVQGEDTASYRPFTAIDELRDLLLDDLAVLLTERFDGAQEAAPSAPRPRHNLPAPASTFIGRETELRDVVGLIDADDVRCVTLRGPAGTGKTRLAIRAAAEEVGRFGDGVFFIDLSAERAADDVFAAVARALGIALAGEARPAEVLAAELSGRHVLLVLDNFEQAMPAAGGLVELLERCPAVKVLVTSREALRVRGERAFPVPPMSLPDDGDLGSAAGSEAVRLFCDRAAAVHPGFRLGEGNGAAIVAICRGLDGLPLAIELAAARTQVLDVDDLRVRLMDRLDVLRGGPRDLPERQRTLREAITWSDDLLTPGERRMLRLFAVFSGARLPDLEATAARMDGFADVDVIDALGSLVDKSLVQSSTGAQGGPRFFMLRTIRAYALERLDETPDLAAAARRAHAEQFTDLAVGLHRQLAEASRGEVLTALADELGNVRTAWREWAGRTDVVQLNRLLAPLWGYYDARGDYRSAIELGRDLLTCLAATPDSPERRQDEFAVRMSLVRTEVAIRGYTAEAEHMIRDALQRAEEAGDARQRFPGLRSLGYLYMMRNDFDQTALIARELMAIAEAEGDPLLLSEAHLLTGLGRSRRDHLRTSLGHFDAAVGYAEATRAGYVGFRVGPHPGVVANVVSALTRWLEGSPDSAAATMRHALDLAAELDHPYSMGYALHHAGLLDLWAEDMDAVADRAAALLAIAEVHDYPVWRALALVLEGVAAVSAGDLDAGLSSVDEGFDLYRGLATPPMFWPALLMIRATALGGAGRHDEALAMIGEAEAFLAEGDPLTPDVGIVHGDLLLLGPAPDPAAAEVVFDAMAELADRRGSRMARMRALTRLAVLRRGTPAEADALRALRDVHDGMEEGAGTTHAAAARAALDGSATPGPPP